MTSNQFSRYVATHRNFQTAADIVTDKELCSVHWPDSWPEWLEMLRCQALQTAVKWPAQEADNDAGEPPLLPRHTGCCPAVQSGHCTWRQLAASPMSVHAAGLAMLKSMLRI